MGEESSTTTIPGIAQEISILVETFVPINNRMAGMILNIGTSRILFMTVYAPQQGPNDEENIEVIVMGDLNGHVGQRTEVYGQLI